MCSFASLKVPLKERRNLQSEVQATQSSNSQFYFTLPLGNDKQEINFALEVLSYGSSWVKLSSCSNCCPTNASFDIVSANATLSNETVDLIAYHGAFYGQGKSKLTKTAIWVNDTRVNFELYGAYDLPCFQNGSFVDIEGGINFNANQG